MKALGIPNTKQFYEVTRIDDAVSLHKALQVSNATVASYNRQLPLALCCACQPAACVAQPMCPL